MEMEGLINCFFFSYLLLIDFIIKIKKVLIKHSKNYVHKVFFVLNYPLKKNNSL